MFNPLLLALQFLTIIPVPKIKNYNQQQQIYSVLYYPLVGLIIGGLSLLTMLAAVWLLNATPMLAAALTLFIWVVLTGGLHLDGLADSADAWVGGLGSKERTLEIMKDPRCGVMAVIALCLLLLIKFAAITSLIASGKFWALLVIPVFGRLSILVLFQTTNYVREQGMGALLAQHYPKKLSIFIIFFSTLVTLLYLLAVNYRWQSLFLIVGLVLLLVFLRRLIVSRLGGMTGDTLGAAVEICEMYCLAFLAMQF